MNYIKEIENEMLEEELKHLVPGTQEILEERPCSISHKKASEWEGPDRNIFYYAEMTDKDILFLSNYLGIKSGQSFIMQKGKNATRISNEKLKGFNKKSFNTDVYFLNASKLKNETKFKKSKRKVTFQRKQTIIGTHIDENNHKTEDYIFGSRIVDKTAVFENDYIDSTSSNILYIPGIVVDIDNHNNWDFDEEDVKFLGHQIEYFLSEDYNLRPHYVNFTGRGLQVFFAVNEYTNSNKVIAELVQDTYYYLKQLVQEVLDFLQKDVPEIKKFSVDMGLSTNRQMLRMPGTLNWNSGLVAHNIICNYTMERYIVSEMIDSLKRSLNIKPSSKKWIDYTSESKKRKSKKTNKSINAAKQKRLLLRKRINDDILILNHRGVGSRHNCFTNMSISLMSMGKNDDEILNFLMNVDKTSNYFKSSKDCSNFIRSMRKYFNSKEVNGIYKLSNKTIEDKHYGITEEEYEILPFETYGRAKNTQLFWEKRRVLKFNTQKNLVQDYVLQLFSNKKNITELARKHNISSRTTVYSYIRKFEKEINKIVFKMVKELITNKKPLDTVDKEVVERFKKEMDAKVLEQGKTLGILDNTIDTTKDVPVMDEGSSVSDNVRDTNPRILYNLNSKFLNTFCDKRLKGKILEYFDYFKPPELSTIIQNISTFVLENIKIKESQSAQVAF